MALLPPENVRKLRARMGGFALAASHDPLDYTAAARAAASSRFEREVDPEGSLSVVERARRAEAARRAYYTGLALLSVTTRRRQKKLDPKTADSETNSLTRAITPGEAVASSREQEGPQRHDRATATA
jgi:hypothetical protein